MGQVAGVLYTGSGNLPWEYNEMRLCRLYGCTPSQLHREDYETVMIHLAMMGAEAQARHAR